MSKINALLLLMVVAGVLIGQTYDIGGTLTGSTKEGAKLLETVQKDASKNIDSITDGTTSITKSKEYEEHLTKVRESEDSKKKSRKKGVIK